MQLKKLSLQSCEFQGDLSTFTNLFYLKLKKKAFHKKIDFQTLNHQLRTLKVSKTKINDEQLNKLTNLTRLNIYNCRDIVGTCFKYLKNLEILTAAVCNYDFLNKLTNLKKLKISPGVRTYIDLSFLKSLTNLEYLDITGEGTEVEDFKNLTKLKYLKIEGSFSGKLINHLISLEELHCSINNVEKDTFLKNLENVKRLSLDTPCYEYFNLKQFTNLVRLNISSSDGFSGDCFLHLINLEKLNMEMSDTKKIKDCHFINLKKLKSLNISYCKGITGECFKYLIQLKKLFAEESKVKEEYLEYLQNIKTLYLTNCNQIVNGQFLLNMNRLNELVVGKEISMFRVEIEMTKKRIENGGLLKDIVKEKEENLDNEDY